jgi:PAS domain S-box-containing protein
MQDQSSLTKWLTILFLILGLSIGVMLVPAMMKRGVGFGAAAAGLGIIAVTIILIRIYVLKQRNMLKHEGGIKDKSEVGFVVDTFQDLVGQLKEKEKELERLRAAAQEKADSIEAYNANILQSVPSGVVSIDNELRIKSMNQAAKRILGVESEKLINREFKDIFKEPLAALIKEKGPVARVEFPYVTGDDRHVWLGITTSLLKNAAGEQIGLIFVFTDLTDIKALQAQVELQQRLSQLGEMSAGISHELRNSMSVIAGYAKLLGKKVDPAALPTVDAISTEINNMDKIISELLAFAKPSVLSKELVDLNSLLINAVETTVSSNDSVKTSIQASETIAVQADEILLRQALTNLLQNAVEAMPGGGSIEIKLNKFQSRAQLSIRDTGAGIPKNIIQKIFLPFYTTKEQGIGFGLALVQKIIVSHSGTIEVSSREGEGATFRIVLPMGD